MALVGKVMGAGMPAGMANFLLGDVQDSMTAAGTTQATAKPMGSGISRFTTVASGSGALLPSGSIGDEVLVINAGANALSVYPPVGHSINAQSANAAFSLSTSSSIGIKRISNLLWIAFDSSQSQFVQSGSGATSENLQDIIRSLAVTPQMYGGVADGSTDDTAAIQAAIIYAQSVGKAVFLPAGTYLVSGTLTISDDHFMMFGEGWQTVLSVKSTVGASTDIIKISAAGDVTNIVLENFKVTPQSGTPGRHAISIDITAHAVSYCRFKGLYLDALGGKGIVTLPNASPIADGFFTSVIEDCEIFNGIYLDKAGDSIRVINNTITGSNVGIYIDLQFVSAASTPHGMDVVGNNITNSGGSIHIKNAYGARITRNIFENSAGNSNNAIVDIDGTDGTEKPDNVAVYENFFSTPSAVDAIRVNFARYSMIRGNLINVPGGGGFCYKVTSNAADTQILYNSLSSDISISASMSDSGTRTVYMRHGISGYTELTRDLFLAGQGLNLRFADTAGTAIRVVRFENADNTVQIGTLDTPASNGDVSIQVNGLDRVKCDSSGNTQIRGPNAQRTTVKTAMTLLSAVSGASVTATNLIPDGAFVVGVSTRVTTSLGTGGGTTGYQVGDGSDADRWGAITGTTAGTTSNNSDATASFVGAFTAANNVVITAVGGNFNGTGAIRVVVHYIDITAPTS